MSAATELSPHHKTVVADYANRIPEAQWDRYVAYTIETDGQPQTGVTAFGWIPRDDGRSDFVVLTWEWMEQQSFPRCTTSSAELSEAFADRLYAGEEWYVQGETHVDCRRMEHGFGDRIPNVIRL